MNSPLFSHRSSRRVVTLLCAALAGMVLTAGRASAQAQGPLPASPGQPNPYQSPLFHNGGALDPDTAGIPPVFLPGVYQGHLQGTPTGVQTTQNQATHTVQIVGTVQTQIPSFLLGDYDPALPPAGAGVYYPNHFADGSIYSWEAPFDYLPLANGLVTVDDILNGTPYVVAANGVTATSGFTATNTWVLINNVATFPAAGTAISAEYLRLPAGQTDPAGTAIWQLVEPNAGSYSLYLNIPNDLADSAGNTEPRSTAVLYFVTVRDANGNVTSSTTATASQTEANSNQFLAGPFELVANGSVTVTLTHDSGNNLNVGAAGSFLVADAMTLQTAIGDVQSTPTAINYEAYPNDFKRARYWGIYVPPTLGANQTTQAVGTTVTANALPDTTGGPVPNTTPLFHYGDPTLPVDENGAADPKRRIRQLVYFGRSDPVASQSVSQDNPNSGGQSVNDVTASNGSYRKYQVTAGTVGNLGVPGNVVATWTLTPPATTPTTGANFFVNVHLPRELETRLGAASYTVTYTTTTGATPVTVGPVTISQVAPTTADVVVALPTGAIPLTPSGSVTVNLYSNTGTSNAPANTFVVADSVTLTTGNGQGAIYCVDGFTGSVVWRFETPATTTASAPVFSSPAVVKINVMVTPAVPATSTPAVYQNKLVVIVGDNNGLVYCLDAIGNGDGTSNSNVLTKDAGGNPINGQPIYELQPPYGTTPPAFDPANPHVGTTGVYWVYRPDAATPDGKLHGPKTVTGGSLGTVKDLDVNADLPVPAAFNTSSPNVFVDPNKNGTPDVNGNIPLNADGSAPSNATVYIGNSNGVLYALDAVGTGIDGTTQASAISTGDPFYTSQDLRANPTLFPAVATDPFVPTAATKWWFTLRGPDPNNTNNTSNADIESAPALYVATAAVAVTAATPTGFTFTPTIYIGSAHEQESTSNVGRLYALDGLLGPSGNDGKITPIFQTTPAANLPAVIGPGLLNYNVGQHPQTSKTDATDWSFPDTLDTTSNNSPTKGWIGKSSNGKVRPALGNVTGSPVVFTNPHETNATQKTRIYFAADSGLEVATGSANGTAAAARPDDTTTGRIWAVNLDGSVGTTTNGTNVWSYPLANDPNNATKDTVAEPQAPIGSFLHGTPAMGLVQFPATITGYTSVPTDVINPASILGKVVPMLYIATRGVDDTALYAIDIDGDINAATATASPSGDHRLIYREPSPDGAIFQSSPVLITNATLAASGGNGGSVFLTAGNTFYDISATPISTPGFTSTSGGAVAGPLIRINKEYTGFGPFSSPTVAATSVYDLLTAAEQGNYQTLSSAITGTAAGYADDMTDWVYVGDSSTGFCRGITPNDTGSAFGGIPSELGNIIPPSVDAPTAVDLTASLQAYLVTDPGTRNYASHLAFGPTAPLPVYEWGQNVYIRFANVVPPGTDQTKYVYDHTLTPSPANPVTAYGNGRQLEFDLSDVTQGAAGTAVSQADHVIVPPVLIAASNPLANGFISRTDTDTANNLADTTKTQYLAAYTYTIADGSGRRNTPGSRRRILNARQTVELFTTTDGVTFTDQNKTVQLTAFVSNGNEVSTATGTTNPPYKLTPVPPHDQPTFGILNPIALRGGGTNLLSPGSPAIGVGDSLGPYRPLASATIPAAGNATTTPPGNTTADYFNLEALANGNDIPAYAPPSSAGGGGGIDPTQPLNSTNNAQYTPPLTPHVVVTATPLIRHNSSGDNGDPAGGLPSPSVNTTVNGLAAGAVYGGYALDLYDRSAVGLLAQQLRIKTGTVSSGGSGLYWNDNTNNNFGSGHDSVVNFLPWETAPIGYKFGVGSNPSLDYPDISPSNITAQLHPALVVAPNVTGIGAGQDMSENQSLPAPATGIATAPLNRTVYPNPVQFHISIPRFQPANQQVYYEVQPGQGYMVAGEVPSTAIPNGNDTVFPMGYITTRRVYVPAAGGFYRVGTAYRDVRVYTGVPPDYSMQMGDPTADVGKVPSGFGIQTTQFAGLRDANGVTTFDPYNLDFQTYFQPLKIYNTGNVNLLNVHLDQKQLFNGAPVPLPLSSDAVDPLSAFPAFDLNTVTGPRSGAFGPNNVPEEPFLVRSSLDGDLATAFGHNTNAVNPAIYPGPTFHKAHVGDGSPSILSVPDAPESFVLGATLDLSPNGKPTHALDGANGNLPFKSQPFVSIAAPFGLPVGNYFTQIQLFEGVDGSGYDPNNIIASPPGGPNSFSGLVAQLFPPQYGKAIGGIGSPTVDGFGRLLDNTGNLADAARVVSTPTSNGPLSLTPVSSNATALSVHVIEDRMTDGFTFGAVPMIDQSPAGKDINNNIISSPDFAPAAFRDPASRDLSVYWTSGRNPAAYGIQAANIPFTAATAQAPFGYFLPANPAIFWWNPFTPTQPAGTNSGLTFAQELTGPPTFNSSVVYAFGVNVQAPPTAPSYANTLFCYPVTANTGALGAAQKVTNDPSQVKYGIKGLSTTTAGYTQNLWAFWTTTVRGRTTVDYNSRVAGTGDWPMYQDLNGNGKEDAGESTIVGLPIPAGLTAVSDPAPLLLPVAPVTAVTTSTGVATTKDMPVVEVTYSGTGPDGNVDLYQSRYVPDNSFANTFTGYRQNPARLDLTPFPAVTEILKQTGQPGGWYQTRDVAWSRTSQLNLSVEYIKGGSLLNPPAPLLYDNVGKQLFGRAVFDKATGFLVVTNVAVPDEALDATGATSPHTVYIDYATGRVRFVPALRTSTGSQSYQVRAFFSPLARRITTDSRADTTPITFLDDALKINDAAPFLGPVTADRRWYIWRKAGTGGAAPSATIYYKTQRLTLFLPAAIGVNTPAAPNPPTLLLTSVKINNTTDVTGLVDVDYTRGRIYFPISASGLLTEGQTATVVYTDLNGQNRTITDVVQWQDEEHNSGGIPPLDTATGLNSVTDILVPLNQPVNENNVSAFLEPDAYKNVLGPPVDLSHSHKVWLFWNSTRNGTADVYYETIDPLFAAGP